MFQRYNGWELTKDNDGDLVKYSDVRGYAEKYAELRALCEKMYQVLVDVEMYCDSEALNDKADAMLNEVDQWRKDNED